MTRWIVINLPPWLLLAGLVVVIAGGTAIVQALVRHRIPRVKQGEQNEIAQFLFPVIAVVYGFLIGFIVLALWGQVNTADQTTRTEGAMAAQLARGHEVFGTAESARIRQSLLAYGHAAVAEWPSAAVGQSTPEAENALSRLHRTYESIRPRNDTQRSFLTSSVASLKELSIARTERLLEARTNIGPPLSLWMAILLTSGLVLGFSATFGSEQALIHYGMVAAVSVLVATNLFLVTELSYAFLGEFATSPEPLRAVVEALSPPR
ncbi:bestrophin-like domain [Streptomyces tubercidicus]|uniref:bestrophin-like domain n=1 Tax=Streptomyces tubercidicus TaxID=47759 RepID=UPI0036C2ABE6